MSTIELDFSRIREVMNEAYYPALFVRTAFKVYMGGSGSAKSHTAAQEVIYRTCVEKHSVVAVVRKVKTTLKNSCFALLRRIISDWGLTHLFDINLTEMTLTFRPNGNKILCIGMDDPEKLKSIDAITFSWVEEATELSEEDLDQLDLRIRSLAAEFLQILLTFNPISTLHWLYRRFFAGLPDPPMGTLTQVADDAVVLRTNYTHNRFNHPEYVAKLDRLAERNPAYGRIYRDALWGELENLVYGSFPDSPLPLDFQWDEQYYSLDFGFTHPCALLRHDCVRDEVHFHELLYSSGITIPLLIGVFDGAGMRRGSSQVFADNARPGDIQQLCDDGWCVEPAPKGQGSILTGIDYVRGLKDAGKLYTRPGNVGFNKESLTYSRSKDKNGVLRKLPDDLNNHACDAVRYGLTGRAACPLAEIF